MAGRFTDMASGYTPSHVDSTFAKVIVSNQLYFNIEGYKLQYIAFPEPEYYSEDYSFTSDLQMYINRIAERRRDVYQRAMQDFKPGTPFHIIDEKFTYLLQTAYHNFVENEYKHEKLAEFCADVCSLTRCIHLKGLASPTSCAKSFIELALSMLRHKNKFCDWTYTEMDIWLFKEIEVERAKRALSLKPIVLTQDWVNSPPTSRDLTQQGASGSSRSHDGSFDEDNTQGTSRKSKRLRI